MENQEALEWSGKRDLEKVFQVSLLRDRLQQMLSYSGITEDSKRSSAAFYQKVGEYAVTCFQTIDKKGLRDPGPAASIFVFNENSADENYATRFLLHRDGRVTKDEFFRTFAGSKNKTKGTSTVDLEKLNYLLEKAIVITQDQT